MVARDYSAGLYLQQLLSSFDICSYLAIAVCAAEMHIGSLQAITDESVMPEDVASIRLTKDLTLYYCTMR